MNSGKIKYLTFAVIKIAVIGVNELTNIMSVLLEQGGYKALKANVISKSNDFFDDSSCELEIKTLAGWSGLIIISTKHLANRARVVYINGNTLGK